MNDADLFATVEAIAADGSRDGKLTGLSKLLSSEQGRKLTDYCYNPFITFGVTQKAMPSIPPCETAPDAQFNALVPILDALAARRITGNAAREVVESTFEKSSKATQELFWRVLNKDLKAGVNVATIKAVMPDLFPVFAVMRAQPYEPKRITSFPVAVEPKLDGFRYSFVSRAGSGAFFTRSGKSTPAVDFMVEPMLNALRIWAQQLLGNYASLARRMNLSLVNGIPEVVLDGEMLAGSGFNELSGELRRTDKDAESAVFHVFDMLTWEEFDAPGSVKVPYRLRRARVSEFLHVAASTPYGERIRATSVDLANSREEIQAIYARHRAAGFEGAMVKDMNGFYDKKKSYSWLKVKPSDTEDLEVVGAYPGEPGTKYESCLGGLTVKRLHEGREVEVNVGGGFTDQQRLELWDLWVRDSGAGLLGRLVEVECHEITEAGSMRHPRFIRFRSDKEGEVEDKEEAVRKRNEGA